MKWADQGYEICCQQWLTGQTPRFVVHDHAGALYRCDHCSSFWEETNRAAFVISEETARQLFKFPPAETD